MFWLSYADGRDELPFLIDGVSKQTLSYAQVFQNADGVFEAPYTRSCSNSMPKKY